MIYFDSSATSYLKPECVKKAVYEAFDQIGNAGRGAHAATLQASRKIYHTREQLADLFHITDPSRIAFTMNATESLNIAIQGLLHKGDHVITSVCEHNSVLRPLYQKEKEGVELSFLKADKKGHINYQDIESLWRANTKAIVLTHASNLTGNVHDLSCVSGIIQKMSEKRFISLEKKISMDGSAPKESISCEKAYFIVDASQSAGILPIDVEKMGIDVLCFTGHKGLLGPQGTGGIYVREGIEIPSFKAGGSGVHSFEKEHPSMMPLSLEAGTLNGHGILGLSAGLSFLKETGISAIHEKEDTLMRYFWDGIKDIPGICVYGDMEMKERAPIVSINIGDLDSAYVSDILWEDYEICTRPGAHCAPLMHESFGTEEQGAVRFSFSYFNTLEEVDQAIEAVRTIAREEWEACQE